MCNYNSLIEAALKARDHAHAPYSKFKVGAAIRNNSEQITIGVNVESASYGLSCCAERVAIFKALTEGLTDFSALAIASEGGAAPCGACRQVIAEYAPNVEVILVDTNNPEIFEQTNISSLLPSAFTNKNFPPNWHY